MESHLTLCLRKCGSGSVHLHGMCCKHQGRQLVGLLGQSRLWLKLFQFVTVSLCKSSESFCSCRSNAGSHREGRVRLRPAAFLESLAAWELSDPSDTSKNTNSHQRGGEELVATIVVAPSRVPKDRGKWMVLMAHARISSFLSSCCVLLTCTPVPSSCRIFCDYLVSRGQNYRLLHLV